MNLSVISVSSKIAFCGVSGGKLNSFAKENLMVPQLISYIAFTK